MVIEMKRTCRHCGVELPTGTDARFCFACQSPLDESTEEGGKGVPDAVSAASSAERTPRDFDHSADATSWLPWIWVAGGTYLLVRSGWPPRVPMFTVGACLAIVIGVGLWFVERHEALRPWRVMIRYVLLGVVLAGLAGTIAWDVARVGR
jgi:hypothetical protein